MQAVVTGVEGIVQVRLAEKEPWQAARVGMELTEGAEFRTGPRSAVRVVIPPDQTITLDRLGTMKLIEAVRHAGKIKTDLGMKYGRVRYDIEAAGEEHDAKVHAPSSTLAVRGTRISLYDQPPYVPVAVSLTGAAEFRDLQRRAHAFGGSQRRTKVTGDVPDAAQLALADAVVDPAVAAARTESEQRLIAALVSRGAVYSFDPVARIPVVRGGAGPLTDVQLLPALPGTLNIVLRWTGNANLNLAVIARTGVSSQLIFPEYPLNLAKDGARTAFDHRGGRNGGMEIVYWPGSFPEAIYGMGAIHEGGKPARFSIDVFRGRQRIFGDSSLTRELRPKDFAAVFIPISPATPGVTVRRGQAR